MTEFEIRHLCYLESIALSLCAMNELTARAALQTLGNRGTDYASMILGGLSTNLPTLHLEDDIHAISCGEPQSTYEHIKLEEDVAAKVE